MPMYDYACGACGHRFEVRQSFTDDPLTECPECKGTIRRVIHAPGIVFKGSGFYKTDSRTESGRRTDSWRASGGHRERSQRRRQTRYGGDTSHREWYDANQGSRTGACQRKPGHPPTPRDESSPGMSYPGELDGYCAMPGGPEHGIGFSASHDCSKPLGSNASCLGLLSKSDEWRLGSATELTPAGNYLLAVLFWRFLSR